MLVDLLGSRDYRQRRTRTRSAAPAGTDSAAPAPRTLTLGATRQGVTKWEHNGHEHCGKYVDGVMHGGGSYCIPAQDALYHIDFVDGNPSGTGTLTV